MPDINSSDDPGGRRALLDKIQQLSPDKRALLALRLRKQHADLGRIPTLPRSPEGDRFPLSPAQQRLWFLEQWKPGSHAYIQLFQFRFHGPLVPEVLEQVLNALIVRHEPLRTTFITIGDVPWQTVAPRLTVSVPCIDLSALDADRRAAEAARLAREDARTPFDFAAGPLLRAQLLRMATDDHLLLLTMHHIVVDGWSVGVLSSEIAGLYDAFRRRQPSPLVPLAVQYGDFALWQRRQLESGAYEAQLAFWRQALRQPHPVLEMPTDFPRPPLQAWEGRKTFRLLPRTLVDGVKELARREGVTPFMTLLAALQLLLHRYSNQDDIIVGTPIANRSRVELEPLVGFFANTICLRGNLSGQPTFLELLARTKEAATAAYANQDVPFEKVVEDLAPPRDLSRSALFSVLLQSIDVPGKVSTAGDLLMEEIEFDNGSAKFDLTLQTVEQPDGIALTAEYRTDLFTESTIARMLGHYQQLLESAVLTPAETVSRLEILTPVERQQMVVEWNSATAPYETDRCLHEIVEAHAAARSDEIAVVCGDERMSWGELDGRANQLAHELVSRGVAPGTRVGLCVERSADMVVAILAVLKAGGAYVPMDPTYPPDRLAHMLADASVPVLLSQERVLARLPEVAADLLCLDRDWPTVASRPRTRLGRRATPRDLAYIIFTSGSTGKPKGIPIEHHSVVHLIQTTHPIIDAREDDVWTVFHSYAFDFSVWEMWSPLLRGGRLVVVPQALTVAPADLFDLLVREKVTVLNMTPAALRQLSSAREEAERRAPSARHSLRLLCVGGDSLPGELVPQLLRWGVPLWNFYGPTESTVWASLLRVDASIACEGTVPVGRPLPDTDLFILDAQLSPVPIGIVGELCIGGTGLARGYLNRPELTAEKFVAWSRPGVADDQNYRIYRTGDVARYREDGTIEFLGRSDHQVKIRGYRIELGEIEHVLSQHPLVKEAVVLAREDASGDKRLVAYLVIAPTTSAPSSADLRVFVREQLPEQMVPSVFVTLESMPLTPNSKVDRKALPAPDITLGDRHEHVAPREVVEQQLRLIWERVLGIRHIGVTDNFFDLGGHSMLAIHLFDEIERTFGKRLILSAIFATPTIEQLANAIRGEGFTNRWSSLVPIQPGGSKPPLFLVHGGGAHVLVYEPLSRLLGPDQPVYGLQARGLSPGETFHTRIPDMAAHYLAEIRSVQPEGPYYLGGASYGGQICYEMAQQIVASGDRVALLVFFDTWGPGYLDRRDSSTWPARMLRGLYQTVEHHAGSLVGLERGERLPYVRERLSRMVREVHYGFIDLRKSVRERIAVATGRMTPEDVAQAQYWMAQASESYVPQPYDGTITLFLASSQPPGVMPDRTLGWGSLARVDVIEVDAYHAAMISVPRVRAVAHTLQERLQDAQLESDRATDESGRT